MGWNDHQDDWSIYDTSLNQDCEPNFYNLVCEKGGEKIILDRVQECYLWATFVEVAKKKLKAISYQDAKESLMETLANCIRKLDKDEASYVIHLLFELSKLKQEDENKLTLWFDKNDPQTLEVVYVEYDLCCNEKCFEFMKRNMKEYSFSVEDETYYVEEE